MVTENPHAVVPTLGAATIYRTGDGRVGRMKYGITALRIMQHEKKYCDDRINSRPHRRVRHPGPEDDFGLQIRPRKDYAEEGNDPRDQCDERSFSFQECLIPSCTRRICRNCADRNRKTVFAIRDLCTVGICRSCAVECKALLPAPPPNTRPSAQCIPGRCIWGRFPDDGVICEEHVYRWWVVHYDRTKHELMYRRKYFYTPRKRYALRRNRDNDGKRAEVIDNIPLPEGRDIGNRNLTPAQRAAVLGIPTQFVRNERSRRVQVPRCWCGNVAQHLRIPGTDAAKFRQCIPCFESALPLLDAQAKIVERDITRMAYVRFGDDTGRYAKESNCYENSTPEYSEEEYTPES